MTIRKNKTAREICEGRLEALNNISKHRYQVSYSYGRAALERVVTPGETTVQRVMSTSVPVTECVRTLECMLEYLYREKEGGDSCAE